VLGDKHGTSREEQRVGDDFTIDGVIDQVTESFRSDRHQSLGQ